MLLDSNIIIYSAQRAYGFLQPFMEQQEASCSAISQLETLGYPHLSVDEKYYLETCFSIITVYPVTSQVIQRAIGLRQQRKMSLGDAVVTATALEHGQTLVTRNDSDFKWIAELSVLNPFEERS